MRLVAIAVCVTACRVPDPPPIEAEWKDDFGRDSIGANYFRTGGGYRITDGVLQAQGAHNHPLWLRKKLPADFEIELDTWSNSAAGDIKIEVCGDGLSYDADGGQYKATAYVLVFGAWHNSRSIIAREDEHGSEIAKKSQPKVQVGQKYHWLIRRKGRVLEWFIDDMSAPFLRYDDRAPLRGNGHEYFGFNNWETDTRFDNLVIRPLK